MKKLIRCTLKTIPWIILSPAVFLTFPFAIIVNIANWSLIDSNQSYRDYFKKSITEFFDMKRFNRSSLIVVGSGTFLFFSVVWPGAVVFITDWAIGAKIIICLVSGTMATWAIVLVNWWSANTYT